MFIDQISDETVRCTPADASQPTPAKPVQRHRPVWEVLHAAHRPILDQRGQDATGRTAALIRDALYENPTGPGRLEDNCLVPGLMETIKPRRIKNGGTTEVPG